MLTSEAVAALGYPSPQGLDAVVVRFHQGKPAHHRLSECAHHVIDNQELYLATGFFLPNTIHKDGGRKEENLARILSFPFDFDLSDYLDMNAKELWTYPQSAIDTMIAGLRNDVEEIFRLIGLPIHVLVYTGYGLAAHVRIPPHKRESIRELRALHKAIVARINAVARFTFADPQVSDAGTRIMRLPGTVNKKGPEPRPTYIVYAIDGLIDEAQLRLAANQTGAPPVRVVPKTGQSVDDATEHAIIEAIRPHWTLGQKHAMGLALSGMLAKAGFPRSKHGASSNLWPQPTTNRGIGSTPFTRPTSDCAPGSRSKASLPCARCSRLTCCPGWNTRSQKSATPPRRFC
jgi:hypothetical protein